MPTVKSRDPRRNVYVKARMNADRTWADVTICNVSKRGMMVKATSAPKRGEYVEIRHSDLCVIGRVVWAAGPNFGVRAQDDIDVTALLQTRAASPPNQERRAAPRKLNVAAPAPNFEAQAERSRMIAHVMNWSILAMALVCGAAFVAEAARSALSSPLQHVRNGLQTKTG